MQCPGVVIPAHDAGHRLSATLHALVNQNGVDSLRTIVAVNNCTDDTAGVASGWCRRFHDRGWEYDVVHAPVGKAAALNAAEATMAPGIRIYVDQDAVLSPDTVRLLVETLREGTGIHFAAPRPRVEASRSPLVRSYYSTWEQLPYVRESKFWPAVGRLNNVLGDRKLFCSCPPIEAYSDG